MGLEDQNEKPQVVRFAGPGGRSGTEKQKEKERHVAWPRGRTRLVEGIWDVPPGRFEIAWPDSIREQELKASRRRQGVRGGVGDRFDAEPDTA